MTRARFAALAAFPLALVALAPRARATPLDVQRVPADAGAVIHVDVDQLRKSSFYPQVYGIVASQQVPPPMRPIVDGMLDNARAVTVWLQDAPKRGLHGSDTDEALVIEFPPGSQQPARLVETFAKLTEAKQVGGRYVHIDKDSEIDFVATGNLVVLADRGPILDKALAVIAGKAPQMTEKMLPGGAPPHGVFAVVALGSRILDQVKQSANSALLKTDITSLAIDVGEFGPDLRARAVAVMSDADGAQKVKSVIDGLIALASLSNDIKLPRPITDYVSVKVSGTTVELDASFPTAELEKLMADGQASAKTK